MKLIYSLVILSCALWEATGYPYYPSYGNVDSYSYGDASRGGMALSRYYSPYYNPQPAGAGMATFMFRQPVETVPQQSSQYYLPDRRRQVLEDTNFNVPPQQNEVYYPQQPENPSYVKQPENPSFVPTEATELAEPTEKVAELAPTTVKAIVVPELVEPEVEEIPEEEPVPKPKKAVSKRKQVKRPIDDEDEEESYPKMPYGAYFPMFFGFGGGRSGGNPGQGPTAIANAFSTGRGGVATSHATAYGVPRPEERTQQ